MLPTRAVRPFGSSIVAAAFLLTCLATPAAAQAPAADAGPNAGDLHTTGNLDFSNAYFFRGIRQETDGLIIQPSLDVGYTIYKGDASLKTFSINLGTWNSIHHDAPSGQRNPNVPNVPAPWYESDFYATLGFGVSGGVNVGMTYTSYTSPAGAFTTVKEVAFKFTVDDTRWVHKYSFKPYGIIATEFDTATGQGQADGAFCQGAFVNGCTGAGTYIEIGGAPTFPVWRQLSVSVPIKAGFGLIDYYQASFEEANGAVTSLDSKFGFFSIAAAASLPFTSKPTHLGNWNLHASVEYLALGEMPKFVNNDDGSAVNVVVGLGFSY
jgi:hypothetical protein